MILAIMCGAPGLVLWVAGALVCAVSERRSRRLQGLAGIVMCGAGALGVDAALHSYASWALAWPMLAGAVSVAWLVFGRHQSPTLQRWSVSRRGGLDEVAR